MVKDPVLYGSLEKFKLKSVSDVIAKVNSGDVFKKLVDF